MVKTMVLGDDVHKYLKKVQNVYYNKYEKDVHMSDIVSYMIKKLGIEDPDAMADEIYKDIDTEKVAEIVNIKKNDGTAIENSKRKTEIEKRGFAKGYGMI